MTPRNPAPIPEQLAEAGVSRVSAGEIVFRVASQRGGPDGGPSIRVLGSGGKHEYLRFDLFAVKPHYHYSPPPGARPQETDRRVMLDTDAEGDPVLWVIARLRQRLGPMLTAAGGQDLADRLDQDTVRRAVDQIEALLSGPALE